MAFIQRLIVWAEALWCGFLNVINKAPDDSRISFVLSRHCNKVVAGQIISSWWKKGRIKVGWVLFLPEVFSFLGIFISILFCVVTMLQISIFANVYTRCPVARAISTAIL